MSVRIKGLSLWQPWASLMAIDRKRNETRGWLTTYRGPLLICSTKAFPKQARAVFTGRSAFEEVLQPAYPDAFEWVRPTCWPQTGFWRMTNPRAFPLGCALAVVDLVEIKATHEVPFLTDHEMAFGDYSAGRFAWYTKNVRKLEKPIPTKGGQGLWKVGAELLAKVEEQVGVLA